MTWSAFWFMMTVSALTAYFLLKHEFDRNTRSNKMAKDKEASLTKFLGWIVAVLVIIGAVVAAVAYVPGQVENKIAVKLKDMGLENYKTEIAEVRRQSSNDSNDKYVELLKDLGDAKNRIAVLETKVTSLEDIVRKIESKMDYLVSVARFQEKANVLLAKLYRTESPKELEALQRAAPLLVMNPDQFVGRMQQVAPALMQGCKSELEDLNNAKKDVDRKRTTLEYKPPK